MDRDIIEEAINRIPGLPTFSRIEKQINEKFNLHVSEEELRKNLQDMLDDGELKEITTTIKGNEFKGYQMEEGEGVEREEKTQEKGIIDEALKNN